MSQETHFDDDPEEESTEPPRPEPNKTRSLDGSALRRYLNYGAILVLTLLALLATFRFYVEASAAVSAWVSPAYRSVFQALFNLVVLLVAGAGITVQVRRVTD